MKCPVCRYNCDATVHRCSVCGFDRINIDFLNIDDAEAWKRKVNYAKIVWFMNESYEDFDHFNPKCDVIERTLLQLNTYFNFDEQLEHIRQNPSDYTARSWFIDCLREVYILTGTYPVTSRKYVKGILEEHMSFFERTDVGLGRKREYMISEHLVHRAEMALADCDFTSAFRCYQQYLFEIKRLKEADNLAQIEEAARCILHNCHVLCEFLSVNVHICDALETLATQYYNNEHFGTEEGQALIQRIKEQERRSLYVHSLGCGLSGAFYTDKDDSWIIKTHQATSDSCVFDYKNIEHYSAGDLSMMDCQLLPIVLVDGLMYRIEYVTDAFSISEAIYLHKESVEQLATKLTTIHGLFD